MLHLRDVQHRRQPTWFESCVPSRFVTESRRQIERAAADRAARQQLVQESRRAVARSYALLRQCNRRDVWRSTPASVSEASPLLEECSVVTDGRTHVAKYGVMSSGYKGGFFMTVHSEYGERSAWVCGIDPSEASELILQRLLVDTFLQEKS